jgi:hypothetical protein
MYGGHAVGNRPPPSSDAHPNQQQQSPPPQKTSSNFSSGSVQHDFSRTVSSSFGDNNSKSSTDKVINNTEKPSSIPEFPDFTSNYYKNDDDNRSIGSKNSETSWRILNQVASIEEEKFRNAEAGRLNDTSPTGGETSGGGSIEGKKDLSDLTPSKIGPLTSLSSVASIQEPLDTSNIKDELELLQCSSSGSLLFNSHEDTVKRGRERREDVQVEMRDDGDDGSRKAPSPQNVEGISMEEYHTETDDRPMKKPRSSSDEEYAYDNPPGYSFSLDSAASFSKDQYADLPPLTEKPRAPSLLLGRFGNIKEGMMGPSLWDIKGQDSFGGCTLSVASSCRNADSPVITSSFSFGKESTTETDQPFPSVNEDDSNSTNRDESKSIAKMKSADVPNSLDQTKPPMVNYPPQAPTWVTNSSSHLSGHAPHLYAPSSYQHQGPMMRNFSQDSGRTSPASSGLHPMHHYGPLHGPYGAPLPPHIPPSDAHLPPSFRPPHPTMSNHPHLVRQMPPPVYMMSAVNTVQPSMTRHTSTESNITNAASGVYSWSKQDDSRLTDILKKYKNPTDWKPVAKDFGRGKTAKECHERWIRYLKPGVRKGQWQDHEDAIVVEAVTTSKEQPFTRWSDLAQRLPGRVGKQIRDRWVNHLNPNINHMPFTREDDLLLWKGHKGLGKRWVEISTKYFQTSRSENHIKNRWYSASFKKFVANEFGPDAYTGGKKKDGKAKAS